MTVYLAAAFLCGAAFGAMAALTAALLRERGRRDGSGAGAGTCHTGAEAAETRRHDSAEDGDAELRRQLRNLMMYDGTKKSQRKKEGD